MVGHIKIDRKILEWEWYQDIKVFHFFLYLLLKANHKDGNWKGTVIKRGQLIIGRQKASKVTGLSESEIRTCIKKLILTKEIATNTTNKNTLITICKYDVYQSNNYTQSPADSPTVQPTNRQQIATNNNDNNNKEDNTYTEPIGIGIVREVANKVWKDTIWIESLCMSNGLKLNGAKDWMQHFNLSISQDSVQGFNEAKYKKMFSGWLRMKLGGGQKIVKTNDKEAEDRKHLKSIGL